MDHNNLSAYTNCVTTPVWVGRGNALRRSRLAHTDLLSQGEQLCSHAWGQESMMTSLSSTRRTDDDVIILSCEVYA